MLTHSLAKASQPNNGNPICTATSKKNDADRVKALDSVNWDAWFYGEGLELPVKMEYNLSLAKQAYELAERWDRSRNTSDLSQLDFKSSDLDKFDSNQIVVFLERLQSYPVLPSPHIAHLGNIYRFSATPNAEIRLRFYTVALTDPSSTGAQSFAPEAAGWVVGDDGTGVVKGRMKFCRPIFKAVYKVDPELSVAVFTKSKDAFHPIARKLIEKDLGINALHPLHNPPCTK